MPTDYLGLRQKYPMGAPQGCSQKAPPQKPSQESPPKEAAFTDGNGKAVG